MGVPHRATRVRDSVTNVARSRGASPWYSVRTPVSMVMVIHVGVTTETSVIMKGVLCLRVVMMMPSEPRGSVVVIVGPLPPTVHGVEPQSPLRRRVREGTHVLPVNGGTRWRARVGLRFFLSF